MNSLTLEAAMVFVPRHSLSVSGCGGGVLDAHTPHPRVSGWTRANGDNTLGQYAQRGFALHTLRVEGTL